MWDKDYLSAHITMRMAFGYLLYFYFILLFFLVKGTISETHENHFVKFTKNPEIHKSTAEDVDVFPSQKKKERKHNPFSLTFVVARNKMKPRFQLSPDKYVHLTYGMFWEIKQLVGQNPCHSPRFALCSRVGGILLDQKNKTNKRLGKLLLTAIKVLASGLPM